MGKQIDGEMRGLAFDEMEHRMPDEVGQLNGGDGGHPDADERGDFVLATYREIAARFSLGGPNAARTKVKRAGWVAEPSNHPADPLHIRVPRDAWYQAANTAHLRQAERTHVAANGEASSQQLAMPYLKERPNLALGEPPSRQPDTPYIRALEGHIASLQAYLAAERARADRAEQIREVADAHADAVMARADAADADRRAAEARAERAEQGRDAERARADAADTDRRAAIALADQSVALLKGAEARVAAEREHADMLRDRLNAMQEQLADAHAVLQAAEATATRAQQAEAGRDAARMRADRAEQEREADRARADGLQAKLDDMQERLTARQEVVDAAEAIRNADDARLARSRWARLRAAWRGE